MLNLQNTLPVPISLNGSAALQNATILRLFDPHHARIIYSGPVTPDSVKWMVELMDESFGYYQYDVVKLDIESPGGSALALHYLMNRMKSWRRDGKLIWTSSGMSAASAGALMLTMGEPGHRTIDSFTSLTYHFSRVSGGGMITAENAGHLQSRLNQENAHLLGKIIDHVLDPAQWEAWRARMLARVMLAVQLNQGNGAVQARRDQRNRLNRLAKSLNAATSADTLAARYGKWLTDLFNEDRVIDNLEAWCLNLVDQINGITPDDHTLAQSSEYTPDHAGRHTPSKMGGAR